MSADHRTEAVAQAQIYWRKWLLPCDGVIDATMGNGKDTLLLSQLVPDGYVMSFDIQEEALQRTEKRLTHLSPEKRSQIFLTLASHTKLDQFPLPFAPRLIVYNLGYLPGGDKKLITAQESTLESLAAACRCLMPGGAISIVCYSGHPGGEVEEKAVWRWAEKLVDWRVNRHQFERPNAPSLIWAVAPRNNADQPNCSLV